MKPGQVIAAAAAILGVGTLATAILLPKRAGRTPATGACERTRSDVIVLAEPFIDCDVASAFLYELDQRPVPQAVVIHTRGGLAVACAQIAEALLQTDTTAIVPYMAYSGGTLIALSARRLLMGDYAALTPVDPIIDSQRAIHNQQFDDPLMKRDAEEYLRAMSGLVNRLLDVRLRDPSKRAQAHDFLLGKMSPHGWPAMRRDITAIGFAAEPADPAWGRFLCHRGEIDAPAV